MRLEGRHVAVASIVIVISLMVWTYQQSMLSVSQTTVVHTTRQLLITRSVPANTTCSTLDGSYDTSVALEWGTVLTGSIARIFVCAHNQQEIGDSLSLFSDLPSEYGKVTSPQDHQVIPSIGFLLIEIDWQVLSDARPGQVQFTIQLA